MENVAEGGYIDIINWCAEQGVNNCNGTMAQVLKGGHIDIVK